MDVKENSPYLKMRQLYKNYGYVNDKITDILASRAGLINEVGKIPGIIGAYLGNVGNPAEFLDENGNLCGPDEMSYIWVGTGLVDALSGESLYIAFTKNTQSANNSFFAYRASTRKDLERNLLQYTSDPSVLEKDSFHKNVCDMLLIKENWTVLPDYTIIKEFFRILEAKLMKDRLAGVMDANCLYNADNTKVLYNTGLIDIYSNDIMVIGELSPGKGSITSRQLATSKTQIKQEGFDRVSVPPVKLYNSAQELLFSATEDEFDFEDFKRIRHVLEERKERFPEELKSMSDDELFIKLKSSLLFDLKMNARNPYWSAPFYNIKQNQIQHLLPLFTESFSEKPSLAIVVGKGEYYYEVRTVLPLDSAYANAACLVNPPSNWLR